MDSIATDGQLNIQRIAGVVVARGTEEIGPCGPGILEGTGIVKVVGPLGRVISGHQDRLKRIPVHTVIRLGPHHATPEYLVVLHSDGLGVLSRFLRWTCLPDVMARVGNITSDAIIVKDNRMRIGGHAEKQGFGIAGPMQPVGRMGTQRQPNKAIAFFRTRLWILHHGATNHARFLGKCCTRKHNVVVRRTTAVLVQAQQCLVPVDPIWRSCIADQCQVAIVVFQLVPKFDQTVLVILQDRGKGPDSRLSRLVRRHQKLPGFLRRMDSQLHPLGPRNEQAIQKHLFLVTDHNWRCRHRCLDKAC